MNNPLSYSSLRLELFSRDGLRLKPASGFVVDAGEQHYLVTNLHVLAPETQDSETAPFVLKTSVHSYGGQGEKRVPLFAGMWQRITVPLYDNNGLPKWIERRGKQADIAALPILLDDPLKIRLTQSLQAFNRKVLASERNGDYWVRISAIPVSTIDTRVNYSPPDPVHVIGYPLGWMPAGPDKSSSAFWRTSWIASEIHEPGTIQGDVFFIDPCAPEGMSGSPVIGMKEDQLKLLGVYSDRALPEVGANAGLVWEAWLIKELIGYS
jgi:hypothetical protein